VICTHEYLGHFGENKVFHHLFQYFTWPGMRRSIHKIMAACDICQKTKYPNSTLTLPMQSNLPKKPGELLCIDLFGPLLRANLGMTCLLVVMDAFSKYVVVYPLRRPTTDKILRKILYEYIPSFGKPVAILSDCGSQFMSKRWNSVLKDEQIRVKYTSLYHPASNPVERVIWEIGRICRTYCQSKHSTWPAVVPRLMTWLNMTVHDSTGYTPYQIQFGRNPNLN
jgi:transposase InsO family protein